MTLKRQFEKANKLLRVIEEAGIINMYDAIELAGLSLVEYYQIRGWFLHKYQDVHKMIEYNKANKTFRWCTPIQITKD